MITIRDYREIDAEGVGRLIANTYREFNLTFAPPEQRNAYLGPFQFAFSSEKAHREEIAGLSGHPWCLSPKKMGRLSVY